MGADVVLIGLDGADRDVVERLTARGELPVLARLRAQGLWGEVQSIAGLGDDAAWSSFATGVGPDEHGRRFYKHYRPGTYDYVVAGRDAIRVPPFWDAFARDGRRVAVLDLPKAPVGSRTENLVVVDWMSHGGHEAPAGVHPATTWATPLSEWFDRDETTWDCHRTASTEELAASLREHTTLRADCAIDVLDRADWDVMIAVFAETHCSGHLLWHELEKVEAVYRDADAELGRIVDACGPSTTVIVFSLLGMTTNHPSVELADAVLQRIEPGSPRGPESWTQRRVDSARARIPNAVRRHIPARFRRAASNARDRQFGRRRFWRIPTDLTDTPIRLNVIGREPYGKVAPGADYDALCNVLRDEFLALVEPGTGRHLVREVVITAVDQPGGAPSDFADVSVVWDRTLELAAATSGSIGEVRVDPVPSRPGEHRDGGFVAAAGPGIRPGVLATAASVVDFAPTVAGLVGSRFDGAGRAIPGVIRDAVDQAAVGSTLNDDHSSA